MVTGLPAHPAHVILRVAMGNADHGMGVVLWETKIAPGCGRVGLISFAARQAAPSAASARPAIRRRRKRSPLPACYMKFANRQLADVDASLQTFLVKAALLVRRRAHDEIARRYHDQLRALGAVAKHRSGLDSRCGFLDRGGTGYAGPCRDRV